MEGSFSTDWCGVSWDGFRGIRALYMYRALYFCYYSTSAPPQIIRFGSPGLEFLYLQHSSPEKEHVHVYSCSRSKQMLEPLLYTRLHGYPSETNTHCLFH